MGLEVFAESELFWKAELVGYLFHLQVALQQQMFGLADGEEVEPR